MMRYNIFNQIHKGLRALLYDTALKIQQTDFAAPEEAASVLEQTQMVLDFFDGHAAHEDHFILPAIEAYEPDTVMVFEQEHGEDHALAEKLRGLISAYQHALSTDGKLELGNSINVHFVSFMVFNLEHMAKEEKILNRALWKYYSDAEIMAINKKIVMALPAEQLVNGNVWMMRGLNDAELAAWMKAVQRSEAAPMLPGLLELAEKQLNQKRFEKLSSRLTEGALLAS
ncbi:MAG TPA: hemerythrin domain-containing protein [Chitinophagaceae bacterium]|nr:hemerythrin domain-containing protein [Chitinophagaceae bacterium]